MRILKSLIISTFLSGVTLWLTALGFALFAIYFPGRLIDWLNQNDDNGMSPFSYLLAIITIAVFITMFIHLMNLGKSTKDTPPTPETE